MLKKNKDNSETPEGRKARRPSFSPFKPRDKQPNFILSVLCHTVCILLVVVLVFGVGGFGALMGVAKGYYETTPDLDVDKIETQNLTSFIYDCNGELITAYKGTENRVWAYCDEIPENLVYAFVAVEDARFFTHNGIDIKRIIGAFVSNLQNESTQGGSTITQQLVKTTLLSTEQSYKRKLQEAYLAIELESEYSKEQILEWYLNIIPLGESNYGVKAAAKDYYDKDLSELTLRECASLAAITRNPSRYNPRRNYYGTGEPSIIDDRTDYVLECMYDNGFISKAEYDAALADSLTVVEDSTVNDLYDMPSAVETVLDDAVTELLADRGLEDTSENRSAVRREIQEGGYHIYSTIDPEIQNIVEDVLYNWEDYPELADPSDEYASSTQAIQPQAACVIYDYTSGEIRAVVGSRTPQTQFLVLNRATDSNMPVGSSIKPLAVYGPALDKGYSPGSVSSNLPVPIEGWGTAKGYPSNFTSGTYRGMVTLRAGMRASLNTVAANTLMSMVGISDSVEYLEAMGIDPDHINADGSGLALGSSGITVREMAQAFGTIANSGTYQKPLTFTKITDADGNVILDMKAKQAESQRQVFREGTAYMLVDMLVDAVQSGSGRSARIDGMTVGGKTGTHSDYKSVFFAGFTPYLSGAVWVGHDEFKSLYSGATGGKEAAPIWKAVMERIIEAKGQEDKEIIEDDPESLGLTRVTLCSLTGKLATDACRADDDFPPTTDWCHADSVPTETCDLHVTLPTDATTGQIARAGCPNTREVAYQVVPSSWGADNMDDDDFYVYFPHGIRGYNSAEELLAAANAGALPQNLYCSAHGDYSLPDIPEEGSGDSWSDSNVYPSYDDEISIPDEDGAVG